MCLYYRVQSNSTVLNTIMLFLLRGERFNVKICFETLKLFAAPGFLCQSPHIYEGISSFFLIVKKRDQMEPKGVLAKHARALLAGFLRPSPASSFFVELPASSSVRKFSSLLAFLNVLLRVPKLCIDGHR